MAQRYIPLGTPVKEESWEKKALGFVSGYDSAKNVCVQMYNGHVAWYAGGLKKATLADVKRAKEALAQTA